MKKLCKNIAALALAFMLVVSMGVPAFATSIPAENAVQVPVSAGSTANVTVGVSDPDSGSANGGDNLLAYKVVKIVYEENTNNLTYTFTDIFQAFQADEKGAVWKNLKVKEYGDLGENDLKELLGEFTAYIKGLEPKPAADYTATANASGIATFADMAMGQYIIVGDGTSKGAKIYQTVTAEVEPEVKEVGGKDTYVLYDHYEAAMKTTTPSVDKTITEGAVEDTSSGAGIQTASIGDIVTYSLKVTVPTYPEGATNKTFYLGDILSKGLELDVESIAIVSDAGEPVDGYTHNTAIDPVSGETTLYIDFDFDKIAAYNEVIVTYKAKLTDDALLGTASGGNPNNVDLVYSNSPFDGASWKPGDAGERPEEGDDGIGHDESEQVLYTYALAIEKFEEAMPWEKLAGAEFELYDNEACEGEPIDTLITNENGLAFYKGLAAGTYWLKETKAPAGFNLMDEPVKVVIDQTTIPYSVTTTTTHTDYVYTTDAALALEGHTDQAKDKYGNLLYLTADGKVTTAAEGNAAAYIKEINETTAESHETIDTIPGVNGYYLAGIANSAGAHLPSTGGMGTTMLYVIGSILVLGAAVLLITKRRMSSRSR